MFISYKLKNYLDNYENDKVSWVYELTDSEFGTISGIGGEYWIWVGGGSVVIEEYSKRNLNVAKNLIFAFVWYNKLNTWWSIQDMIDFNKNRNPLFLPYEEDLQKYLLLL